MQDAWLAFVRTGDPSTDTIGRWPEYGKMRSTMLLGRECRVEDAPYEGERSVWDTFDMVFTKPI